MREQKKILLVEDERHISEGIELNLSLSIQNIKIDIQENGDLAFDSLKNSTFDLVLLDLMLPGRSGIDILKEIRKRYRWLPVLVITAIDQKSSKIDCLSLGADDYILKPFDIDELILKVKRLLKKSDFFREEKDKTEDNLFRFGPCEVNFINSMAKTYEGETIILTHQEQLIMKLFQKNLNKVIKREELLEKCWGYDSHIQTRTLDNFIARLRKYFEKDPKDPQYILSKRSVGYIFKGDQP